MSHALPDPLHRWRLYPEAWRAGAGPSERGRRTLYVTAHVWATKADMLRVRRANGYRGDCQAYVAPLVRVSTGGRRERVLGEVAEVHFHRARLGTEIVTHEMTHAALAWYRRRAATRRALTAEPMMAGAEIGDAEEAFCYALGSMVRDFVNRAHDAGLYAPVSPRA